MFKHHRSTPAIFITAASLLGAWFFIGGSLRATNGIWTSPLDDTFIHFQYAKQIARANWFQYFQDAPITSGDTSFLYPLILAAGFTAGFTGLKLLWFAYALGLVSLIATGYLIFQIGLYFKLQRRYALWIALLAATNGWILWGYFSGMEIALQSTFLLATLFVAQKEINACKLRVLPWLFLALALIRPEGFIASAILALFILYKRFIRKNPIRRWHAAFIPFVAIVCQSIFYRLVTNEWVSNTFILKTWWYALATGGFFHADVVNKLLKLAVIAAYFAPRAFIAVANDIGIVSFIGLALMLAGAIFARAQETLHNRMPLTITWVVIFGIEFLAILNIYGATEVSRHRYFIFLAPLALFFMLYFLIMFCSRFSAPTRWMLFTALTILSIANTVKFQRAYVLDNQNIYEMHYKIAGWVNTHTKQNDIIAMNDAGVVPYITDRPFFDVMGLVTGGVARAVHEGPDAFMRFLLNLPPNHRPAYFIIFPGWFDTTDVRQVEKLRAMLKLFGAPIAEFRVSNQTIVPYSSMSIFKPLWTN